ncbi:MAG: hypothetical protein Q8P75_02225 [bacterium]|nr:hypothetical protein [bacterium]
MPIWETKFEETPGIAPKTGGITKYTPAIAVVLAIAAVAGGVIAYRFRQEVAVLKANPNKTAQEEVQALIDKVGQIIVLPQDERPTIATVADPEKLKDQPFFAKAKRGDRVLIYTTARKAILYDPVGNKIVEVAPVTIGTSQTAGAATEE